MWTTKKISTFTLSLQIHCVAAVDIPQTQEFVDLIETNEGHNR